MIAFMYSMFLWVLISSPLSSPLQCNTCISHSCAVRIVITLWLQYTFIIAKLMQTFMIECTASVCTVPNIFFLVDQSRHSFFDFPRIPRKVTWCYLSMWCVMLMYFFSPTNIRWDRYGNKMKIFSFREVTYLNFTLLLDFTKFTFIAL